MLQVENLVVVPNSCSVWHQHRKSNKDKIEKVQRRAARNEI